MSEKVKLSIPWGSFGLTDLSGITEWRPNHHLEMTAQEQFDRNKNNGILKGLNIRSLYGCYDGTKEKT